MVCPVIMSLISWKRSSGSETLTTDEPHRATHINAALVPVCNYVFMELPVESQSMETLFSDILRYLETKQVDGRTVQEPRLVAKKKISAGLEPGGPSGPEPR
jgi:hypothetical protein